MDRPHIIYCRKTGKYVAWLKNVGGEISQFMSVLVSDRFSGPYTFVRKIYKPLSMDSGDFCLHVDGKTGKAYIWFERPHFELICATLTEDYTACTGEYSEHYPDLYPPYTREAPVYFEHEGRKYLFTSGTSGYYPNASRICTFEDYHGKYRDLGDPCVGDWSDTTFNSQISCVLNVPGTGMQIACGDRWHPERWIPLMSKQIISGMERHFKDYEPDRFPKEAVPFPGVEQKNVENTCRSRYVWLPLEWEGEKSVLCWRKEWHIPEKS